MGLYPIITQTAIEQMLITQESMDWHELNCCDSKLLQIFDHGSGGQPSIRST